MMKRSSNFPENFTISLSNKIGFLLCHSHIELWLSLSLSWGWYWGWSWVEVDLNLGLIWGQGLVGAEVELRLRLSSSSWVEGQNIFFMGEGAGLKLKIFEVNSYSRATFCLYVPFNFDNDFDPSLRVFDFRGQNRLFLEVEVRFKKLFWPYT